MVPTESPYATFYLSIILTYILSRTISELSIGQIIAFDRGGGASPAFCLLLALTEQFLFVYVHCLMYYKTCIIELSKLNLYCIVMQRC